MDKETPLMSKVKDFFVRKDGGERALLTKQAIAIIVVLAVLIIGLLIYFIFAKPAEESAARPDIIYDGEEFLESSGVLLMFPQRERNDINSITVSNKSGEYKLNAFSGNGYTRFVLSSGSIIYAKTADLIAIYSDSARQMRRSSGYSAYVVAENVDSATLSSRYGISKSSELISVTDGEHAYSFYLGDQRILDGGASYYITSADEMENETHAVYSFIALTASTQFVLEGYESTTLDDYSVSAVVVASTVVSTATVSKSGYRVDENATEEDLSKYGLDEASSPSWVNVELTDGTSYKFIIGDMVPSRNGYYALADGRRGSDGGYIVYILTKNTGGTFVAGSESLLSTLVLPSIGSLSESITDFRLYRAAANGEMRELIMQAGLTDEYSKTAESNSYRLIYPSAYTLDENEYSNNILPSLAYIYASEVMSFGQKIHSEEVYSAYGLDLDNNRLENGTDLNHAKITFSVSDSPTEENTYSLYFSEKMTSDKGVEFYYVYSPSFEAIYKLSTENFGFVEWGLAKFTRGYLYFNYINCTDYFELVTKKGGVRYTLVGNELNMSVSVTEAGNDGKPVTRIDSATGATVAGEFHVQPIVKTIGTYTSTEYVGDFENFRSLYYVLITRTLSIDEELQAPVMSEQPSYVVTVAETPADQPISYTRYDEKGNKVYYTDSNGNTRTAQVRYAGGNLICSNIEVTLTDGTTLKYDTAYYDETEGRFFTKILSTNDGNYKPANYKYDADNNLIVSRYLPQTTTGEYTQTIYTHKIYDIYNVVKGADGKDVRQINQTYKYIIPTVTKNTYRIEADGTRTLLSSSVENAENGVLIRTQMVEKLFNDSTKLLGGITIDRESVN